MLFLIKSLRWTELIGSIGCGFSNRLNAQHQIFIDSNKLTSWHDVWSAVTMDIGECNRNFIVDAMHHLIPITQEFDVSMLTISKIQIYPPCDDSKFNFQIDGCWSSMVSRKQENPSNPIFDIEAYAKLSIRYIITSILEQEARGCHGRNSYHLLVTCCVKSCPI